MMFTKDVMRSACRISLRGKYIFQETRINIIDSLKIFIAKVRNILISMVVVLFFFNKVHSHFHNHTIQI